jgi:indolepyruvate ferredoxin oxidoreductase
MKDDPRFHTTEGPEIFTGNELLLKGALETEGGVHFLGGYPGSPVADFFNSMAFIRETLKDKGIRAVINNNEALAAAALNGSQVVGARGMIVFKSVGAHVAADALALGNLAGAHPDGGAVVVYGDDPWSDSTQVAADSRYISKHLFMPVIEPADPQEVKDYVDLGFKLSAASELYAGYVLTTNLADGGGSVQCRPNRFPVFNTRQRVQLQTGQIDLDKYVLLPPKTWWQEEKLADRFERAQAAARRLGLNRIENAPASGERAPLGLITSGLAYGYLRQALGEMGVLGRLPILKFGLSYPVDPQVVREFAGLCERFVVVEERRGFLEEQIGEILLRDRQAGQPAGDIELWGKRFPGELRGIPETRGLHPSILIERFVPLLKRLGVRGSRDDASAPAARRDSLDAALERIGTTERAEVTDLPQRLPTFCAGCPHRDSASLCLEIQKRFADPAYMQRRYRREPVDLVFHGDTGCYTMLMYPPNQTLMHDYSGMGLGGGTGSGVDPFVTNKQVVFMGDSTFFHSGQVAISQAIKTGQDITFIILDNSTTAMTGHQPTPGVDYDILGNPTAQQDIETIVNGLAGASGVSVCRVDPEQRRAYAELLEETFLADGVKVLIATKECGITRGRRLKSRQRETLRGRGFLPSVERMNVNTEICRFCLACAEATGCPGLRHVSTDYGLKMDTDLTSCVNDGACERVRACNSFERVTIRRRRPPRSRVPELGLEDLPEPPRRSTETTWRCFLAGVGGMGIGLATRILVRAGHKEGYEVLFLDKKGLAIRNGGTASQVVYNVAGEPLTAVIPYGRADLLLGVDVLEAARALDPRGRSRVASRRRTAAVVNTDKVSTIRGLMGREDFEPEALVERIRRHTREDDFLARDISRICEKYLGSRLYANIMMLGFAFQKGLIPVSFHSMAWAIKDTLRTDVRKNLYAFNMGRKLVEAPDLFQGPPERTHWKQVLEDRCRHTIRRYRGGHRLADGLRELVAATVHATPALEAGLHRALTVRCYDCLRWGGLDYARQYAETVREVYRAEGAGGRPTTRGVIHNLAAAMLIKDPVYQAELATSPEKYARDREKYNVNPANGDRIRYRHLWHIDGGLGPWRFRFDAALPPWTLKLLKRCRFLRKLLPAWGREQRAYLRRYRRGLERFLERAADQRAAEAAAVEPAEEVPAELASPMCLNCMNATCSDNGCPLGGDIPHWVQLAYQQRWREAAEVLQEANNFPEITSRICPGLCESACKQGINGFDVQIRDLERQVIERAFQQGWVRPRPASQPSGRRVAVVGSGPAGLAAAQQLARAGHAVTVFEAEAAPGGLLRYGIPAERLDRALIDRRVEQLAAEGVTFRTGVRAGKDVTGEELLRDFDAVLLATGAERPRDLSVEGRDTPGIYFALDYLRSSGATDGGKTPIELTDKAVAVIGGGLTGADCVHTALQKGAREVHQLEILPRGHDETAGHGHPRDDEVMRRWCVATTGFAGNGRGLTELKAVRVQWTNSPAGPVMQTVPESDFRLKVDLAVLAVGFEPDVEPRLREQLGLETAPDGTILRRGAATKREGVFLAGDLRDGPGYVVSAISSGREAAEAVDRYLRFGATDPLGLRLTAGPGA